MLWAVCGRSGPPALFAANTVRSAILALLAAWVPAGCIDAGTFACERDAQCEWNGEGGLCLAGSCAVFDPQCDSNYRFHERGDPDIAGQCAEVADPTATTSVPTTSTTVATTAVSSTGVADSTATADPPTTGDGTTGLASCEEVACACATSVAVGLEHTCVARTDGSVVCWGANGAGQLGTGEESGAIPYLREPEIGVNVFIERLWAGNNHTCGLSSDGRLFCWGNNGSGESVPMPMEELVTPQAPVEIDFVPGAELVATAPSHTCAIFDGMVQAHCWGANGHGELGEFGDPPGPYVSAELGVGPAVDMAAGRDHTCVLLDDTVECWAANNLGQLGNPAEAMDTVEPQTVLLDRTPVHMSAGRDHTCVVVTDGTVRCWGGNAVGQIGDGTMANAAVPVTPQGPPGRVVELSGRLDSMCALTDAGDVYCWGDANGDDLGTEVPNGEPLLTPSRVLVVDELPEPIAELDTGRHHICVRTETGRVFCWGDDPNDQLGPMAPPDQMRAVEINIDCP